MSRIDTDMESLFLVDPTETGDPVLDPLLKEIAGEPVQRNAQYWVERLAHHADEIIDSTLDRLVHLKILQHHDGDFWTLARTAWQTDLFGSATEGSAVQFVKTRISKAIFNNEIPDPRDVIIICLINTCDVFRFIFQLDEESEERIELICKMDLIGRSIAAAVTQNLAVPFLRRTALIKKIPSCPVASGGAQSTRSRRQHSSALCGLGKKAWPSVSGPSTVYATHDRLGWARDEPLGASARAHVPEDQRLFRRLREGIWSVRSIALPGWGRPLPATKGPISQHIPADGWKASWNNCTNILGNTWRLGTSGTPCPG